VAIKVAQETFNREKIPLLTASTEHSNAQTLLEESNQHSADAKQPETKALQRTRYCNIL
jgi:hypothetical protein